jgi:hypothetical protein
VDKALDHRGATMALLPNGNSRMVVPYRTGASRFVTRPPSHPIEDHPSQEIVRSASVAYNLFPNIVTPTGPVSFPFLVFWPVARSRTILEVSFYTRGDDLDKDGPEWRERIDSFNRILDEDNENLPWIQRSIESGGIDSIPLSYQERRIYHFHEHVDQVIGIDNVPERLRVQPWCREVQEDGKGQRL